MRPTQNHRSALPVRCHRKYHVDASSVFKLIKNRFIEIKNELGLKQPIEKELDAFYTNLNQMSQAVIVSRGEYFCAKLMAEYLGYAFVDAKDIIRFKLDKSIDWDATSAKLQAKYAQYDHFVFPGFYGTSANWTHPSLPTWWRRYYRGYFSKNVFMPTYMKTGPMCLDS